VKEGEEGKGRERRVWGWALALSVSGRRTHLNTPSFGNGSTPLLFMHVCCLILIKYQYIRVSVRVRFKADLGLASACYG